MSYKKVSFVLRPAAEEGIGVRGSNRSEVINRDLDRLYTLYRRTLPEIDLSTKEALLIVDALNGALFTDALSTTLLWASIEDSIRLDGTDEKWDVDGPALVKKLRDLTTVQAMAVVDAAERFWQEPDKETKPWVRECFAIK